MFTIPGMPGMTKPLYGLRIYNIAKGQLLLCKFFGRTIVFKEIVHIFAVY